MNPTPGDPAPPSGDPGDPAPLGLVKQAPPHELTPEEFSRTVDWDRIAAGEDFKALLKAKAAFIVPACVFFMVYYFALLIAVGYAPHFMETKVVGAVNLAYLFALSQFFMAWILCALYVRAAARHDEMATKVIRNLKRK